jgi:hypothetical protein
LFLPYSVLISAQWTSYVVRGFSQKTKRNSSPGGIRTHTTRGKKFSSQKLYHWATKASKRAGQNLDYRIVYAFSLKIRKLKSILTDALLQKIKNVLIICEYIFDFLKKCVPITDIRQYRLPFQHFSTIFDPNLKIEAKIPKKNCFSIHDRVIASGSNICHCFLYIYQRVFKAHKLNMKFFPIIPPWPTVQCLLVLIVNCSNDLKNFANSRPLASKVFLNH